MVPVRAKNGVQPSYELRGRRAAILAAGSAGILARRTLGRQGCRPNRQAGSLRYAPPEIDVPNMIKDVPRWDRWSLSLMQDWQRERKKIYRDGSVAVIPGGMRASVRPYSAAACSINCIRAIQSVGTAWSGVGGHQLYFCQRRAQRVHWSWPSAARQYRSRWQC